MATTKRNPQVDDRIKAAQDLLDQGICEDAEPLLLAAMSVRPLTGDQDAQVRSILSEVYDTLGFSQKAHEAVEKYEAPSIRASVSPRLQIRLLVRLGRAWDKLRDQPRAIAYFNTALKLAEQAGDKDGIGQIYLAMGRAYRVMNESTIATDCLDRSLQQFRLIGNRRGLAQTYLELGLVDMHEGEYESALNHFSNAETIIKDRPDYFVLGSIYMNSAVVESWQKYSAKAGEQLEKAHDFFTHAKHKRMIARVSGNLAVSLLNSGDWTRASDVLLEALEISRQFDEKHLTANILDNLALLCVLQGRTIEAKRFLDEGLELLNDLSSKWVEVQLRFTNTRLKLVEGDLNRASASAQSCLEIAHQIGDTQFLIRSTLFLSEIALASMNLDQCSAELQKAEALLQENPNLPSLGLYKRLAGQLSLAQGSLEEARHSLHQSLSIFETRQDVYQVAVSNIELGKFFRQIGHEEHARCHLLMALDTLKPILAQPDIERIERELTLIDTGGKVQTPGSPVPELLTGPLIKRLVEASSSIDLLVAETLNVTWQATRVDGALLCRRSQGTPGLQVLGTRGSAGELKEDILRLLNVEDPTFSQNSVFLLCPRSRDSFYLVLVSKSPLSHPLHAKLEPILRVVEQGFELLQLRDRSHAVRRAAAPIAPTEVRVPGFVHSSAAMSRLLEQIHKIRSSDVTVLITGESGTGKELIARAIHAESARRQHRFVPFNCTATSKELVDSQLFGYKKGAFTGAVNDSPGVIKAVEHGTLFLDEIGDLALDVQPKLLRFLQEGEIQPLGEKEPVKVDVRVLAATNSDLEQKVALGTFREDLFHRLNVIRLHIPPLRERREEIPLFIEHFLSMYLIDTRKAGITISQEAIDLMTLFDWPGNVRQLSNEIQRIVAMAESDMLVTPDLLSKEILQPASSASARIREMHFGTQPTGIFVDPKQPLAKAVSQLEKEMLLSVLERHSGNISRAARELGLTRRGLYTKKNRHGIT